jgi:hypothetical protein
MNEFMTVKSKKRFYMNKLRTVKVLIRMSLIVLTFVLFSVNMTSASQWIKTYGGKGQDWVSSIQQTSEGGYVMAGVIDYYGAGKGDVWVLKLDGNGNVQWQKSYYGTAKDYASSIQQTSEGGYIVAGITESFGAGSDDVWVLKLDGNGNVQWQKTYGGTILDRASSIQQTSEGGYIVAGWTRSFGAGDCDAWVLKLDSNGNVQWQKTYGSTQSDRTSSIQQTSEGGYIVAGYTDSFGGASTYGDAWILKLDGNGNVQWQKTYDTNAGSAYSIQQTSDGGYIVAGTYLFHPYDVPYDDAWVMKLDGDGNVQWQKSYGNTNHDSAHSIQQTADGGYIVAGGTSSFNAGNGDAWVLKLDGNGNVQWQKTYGRIYRDSSAYSIQQTADGGYIVAGWTDSLIGGGGRDAWVMKLDGDGNIYNVCSLVKTSDAQVSITNATVKDTNVIGADSNVSTQTSTTYAVDTYAVVQEKCIYGCSLVPDSTTIAGGGTLGFQGTVTNNTSNTGTVLFGTKVTWGSQYDLHQYPSSGYLIGPLSISLDPSQTKSGHASLAIIPLILPYYGPAIYHGYVGNYGAGIYDECTFTFEVVR